MVMSFMGMNRFSASLEISGRHIPIPINTTGTNFVCPSMHCAVQYYHDIQGDKQTKYKLLVSLQLRLRTAGSAERVITESHSQERKQRS